jgi:uncharacterized protein
MTPQETELVNELFDRLAGLENSPRDPEAEHIIAEGARRAPHALYALMQTVLVQDEALKRANARIAELQAKLPVAQESEQRAGSFLDSMREAFTGRFQRGSVPSVRAGVPSPSVAPAQGAQPQPGYAPQMPPPAYGTPPFGGGGSFLGNAASTAAGVVGGALLLDSIRSMFGHHHAAANPSALGDLRGDHTSAWSGAASDSDLARQAGVDHVSDHIHDADDRVAGTDDPSSDAADDTQADADDDSFQNEDDDDAFADDDFDGDGFSDA